MDKHPCIRTAYPDPRRAETLELFRELLGRGISIKLRVTGRSMEPSILDGEVVVLSPPGRLRLGSVVFFVNDLGVPVLHRITGIRDDRVRTMGDALNSPDRWIQKDSVFATASAIERKTPEGAVRTVYLSRFRGFMSGIALSVRAQVYGFCRPGLEAVRALISRGEESGA